MNYPKRISSSLTLLLGLFLPLFWIVFFGSLTIATFIYAGEMTLFQSVYFKAGIVIFFLGGVLFLYFTFLRLKRVEVDSDFIYVTNYFKTYRYPFHNIDGLRETSLILFQLCTIRLVQKGSFGKKIHFLESRIKFQDAIQEFVNLRIALEQGKAE